jgi:hypothetical protein
MQNRLDHGLGAHGVGLGLVPDRLQAGWLHHDERVTAQIYAQNEDWTTYSSAK